MAPAKQSTAATFRNIQRPYHRTGENRRIVTKNHKTPECSNGYRQRGRCDSRPDWHKLTVLISSTGHRDPHRRGSVILFRISRAGHHDTYRHRVTVPDWHKYACTIVRLYYYARMRISPYRYMTICGYAHRRISSLCVKPHGKIDQGPRYAPSRTLDTKLAGP
jgi:hypothetical protein